MGMAIVIDLNKAKSIAHDKRRAARSVEFAPLDIKATIPTEAQAAEAARQVIREKYATMQTQINSVQTIVELKSLLPKE
jgi:hypothetical protein